MDTPKGLGFLVTACTDIFCYENTTKKDKNAMNSFVNIL